jgi:hypothetical protein
MSGVKWKKYRDPEKQYEFSFLLGSMILLIGEKVFSGFWVPITPSAATVKGLLEKGM